MKNECLDAVAAVLDEAGIAYTIGHGGKHYRIDFEVNGRRCRTTCPVTPSDHRAALNGASQVRRIIRQAQEETDQTGEHTMSVDEVDLTPSHALAFAFEGRSIRIAEVDGAPWFVASDICTALEIGDQKQALDKLDDDERGGCSIPTPGGMQKVRAISESGLYTLILRSRGATTPGTPAHRFRKWVTGTVLPSVRKHGAYAADPELMRDIQTLKAEVQDLRAAADLALETAGRLEGSKVAPTVDLASTVTSDDLISLAGIKPGQRVRGTSAFVTGRVLTFTAGHGCYKTPAHLNPSMPWRFPREKGTEWLFGASLGAEQIRNQIERQRRRKAQRARPAHQGHLSLVGAT